MMGMSNQRAAQTATERTGTYSNEAAHLRSLSGVEWPTAVMEIWDGAASKFASSWDDLSHHDQVTIYRILTRQDDPLVARN